MFHKQHQTTMPNDSFHNYHELSKGSLPWKLTAKLNSTESVEYNLPSEYMATALNLRGRVCAGQLPSASTASSWLELDVRTLVPNVCFQSVMPNARGTVCVQWVRQQSFPNFLPPPPPSQLKKIQRILRSLLGKSYLSSSAYIISTLNHSLVYCL